MATLWNEACCHLPEGGSAFPALGLISTWKKIGHVPAETADALEPFMDESSEVVARGTVRAVYAPADRDEAAVTVEIQASTES